MLRHSRLLTAAALVLVAQLGPSAQTGKRNLDKDTFFQMETISNPEISPDGSQVVFGRGFVDVMKDQAVSNLWVIDVNGQRLRQLTDGAFRDSAPVWSPTASASRFSPTDPARRRFT